MCGIFAAVAADNVCSILLKGLQNLEYRGYDSAGLALVENGSIKRYRRKGRVFELKNYIQDKDTSGFCGVAHTRWATHGEPSETNAHPFVSMNRIVVVHNGIVENYEDLKKSLQKKGFKFESQTDSEVIPHLIMHHMRGGGADNDEIPLLDAVALAMKDIRGTFAFCVIDKEHTKKIIAAKNMSPVIVGIGKKGIIISSDSNAMSSFCDQFIPLRNMNISQISYTPSIKKYSIKVWDRDLNAVDVKLKRVVATEHLLDLGHYKHFMHKEIWEQPQAISDTLENRLLGKKVDNKMLGSDTSFLVNKTRNITIVACGSSYHAASVAKYWTEEIVNIPCRVEIASEFRYRKHASIEDDLFIAISQSGETADVLAAHQKAKEGGFFATLAICNVPTSSLVNSSDFVLLTHASPEIGVASTKTFTSQLTAMMLISVLFAQKRGNPEMTADLVGELRRLPANIEVMLSLDEELKKIAERISKKSHALFLGRGAFFPIAQEGALKLKEVSYIHAESYAAGELKHGPLALIDKNMPSIILLPQNKLWHKTMSNIEEIISRGGQVHIITNSKQVIYPHIKGVNVTCLNVESNHCSPIVFTIPLQSLAYHTALLKGTDIDHPRNLAKSVTVE